MLSEDKPVYHRNVVFLWGVRREADQGHNLGGASVDKGGQACQSDTLGSAGMTVFASIVQMGDQVERVSGELTNSTLIEVVFESSVKREGDGIMSASGHQQKLPSTQDII